jgi:hypothetical protein
MLHQVSALGFSLWAEHYELISLSLVGSTLMALADPIAKGSFTFKAPKLFICYTTPKMTPAHVF